MLDLKEKIRVELRAEEIIIVGDKLPGVAQNPIPLVQELLETEISLAALIIQQEQAEMILEPGKDVWAI